MYPSRSGPLHLAVDAAHRGYERGCRRAPSDENGRRPTATDHTLRENRASRNLCSASKTSRPAARGATALTAPLAVRRQNRLHKTPLRLAQLMTKSSQGSTARSSSTTPKSPRKESSPIRQTLPSAETCTRERSNSLKIVTLDFGHSTRPSRLSRFAHNSCRHRISPELLHWGYLRITKEPVIFTQNRKIGVLVTAYPYRSHRELTATSVFMIRPGQWNKYTERMQKASPEAGKWREIRVSRKNFRKKWFAVRLVHNTLWPRLRPLMEQSRGFRMPRWV